MKILLSLCAVLALAMTMPVAPSSAGESSIVAAQGDVYVQVNGLVCDFCARALEKVFGREEAVESIHVDLDSKIIAVTFNEGQGLDNDRIRTLITDAGYNVEDIRRAE
jgi:copper chaperone CopZ